LGVLVPGEQGSQGQAVLAGQFRQWEGVLQKGFEEGVVVGLGFDRVHVQTVANRVVGRKGGCARIDMKWRTNRVTVALALSKWQVK
jgi:hypothetical protein